jgi:hypothetical protein
MEQCEFEVRLAVFLDFPLQLNQIEESCHNAQTGIRCGRPSGRTVATQ